MLNHSVPMAEDAMIGGIEHSDSNATLSESAASAAHTPLRCIVGSKLLHGQ